MGRAQARPRARRAAPASRGSRASVHGLQRALGIAADGVFGPGTLRAVKRFQRSHGLTPDGVVGPATWSALGHPGVTKVLKRRRGATRSTGGGLPITVRRVIAAASRIAHKPYRYGGGHGSFNDSGYDCSGSVSYALHGGGLLSRPMDSGELMSYGAPGPGRYITIYAHSGHAYMVVHGRRFDTTGAERRLALAVGSRARRRATPCGILPGSERSSDAQSLFSPEGTYLNTASYGLPPQPGWDALQQVLEEWRGGRTSWEGWSESTDGARARVRASSSTPTRRASRSARPCPASSASSPPRCRPAAAS